MTQTTPGVLGKTRRSFPPCNSRHREETVPAIPVGCGNGAPARRGSRRSAVGDDWTRAADCGITRVPCRGDGAGAGQSGPWVGRGREVTFGGSFAVVPMEEP
ncbi:hypothetical protein GCM10027589_20420 [Actinocorallia lasiicapitis]